MKKTIILSAFCMCIGIQAFSKVHIQQKSKKARTTVQKAELKKAVLQLSKEPAPSVKASPAPNVTTLKVEPLKIIAAVYSAYPTSSLHRGLLLPQGTKEALGSFEYRYLSNGNIGANVYAKGRYTYYQNWEFLSEVSAFPQSIAGFEFGGIRAGFLYKALSEDEKNPDLGLGLRVGLLGQGIYSLTKNNDFALFPNIVAKKQVADRLSMLGELMLGVGNNEAGVASLSATGIYKTTQDIDTRLKLDLENLGYTFDQIFSATPTIEYHWDQNTDVLGGTHLGLAGAQYLGNNFFVSLAKRF